MFKGYRWTLVLVLCVLASCSTEDKTENSAETPHQDSSNREAVFVVHLRLFTGYPERRRSIACGLNGHNACIDGAIRRRPGLRGQ